MKFFRKKNNNLIFKRKKGFSIIEIIIYLSIFGTLSIFVINSFIVSISSFNKVLLNHSLAEAAVSSMDRISREIRQAGSIDIAYTTSELLQINSFDSSGNDVLIKIVKEGNALNFYRNNIFIGNLLDEDVSVDSLNFRRIETSSGEAVKIEISLYSKKGKNEKIENFYNTIILRGSY